MSDHDEMGEGSAQAVRDVRRRLRAAWRRLRCQHTHTFTYELEGARRIYGDPHGSRSCKSPGLLLEGCYSCGEVHVRDYCA